MTLRRNLIRTIYCLKHINEFQQLQIFNLPFVSIEIPNDMIYEWTAIDIENFRIPPPNFDIKIILQNPISFDSLATGLNSSLSDFPQFMELTSFISFISKWKHFLSSVPSLLAFFESENYNKSIIQSLKRSYEQIYQKSTKWN